MEKKSGSLQRTALGVPWPAEECGLHVTRGRLHGGASERDRRHEPTDGPSLRKEVSKFRLARSAIKLLEAGWAEQRVHVLGARKTD